MMANKKAARYVRLTFFARTPLASAEKGKEFYRLLRSMGPEYLPEFYSAGEPADWPFDWNRLDDIVRLWYNEGWLAGKAKGFGEGTLFRRVTPPRLHGDVSTHYSNAPHNSSGLCNNINLDFPISWVRQSREAEILALSSRLFQWAKADFGFLCTTSKSLHGSCRVVWDAPPPTKAEWQELASGWVCRELFESLPSLFWGNFFGPVYVDFFGRQKLLKAPDCLVEELPEERIFLRLSKSIFDLASEEVLERIEALKQYLDPEAFYDPQKWKDPWDVGGGLRMDKSGRFYKADKTMEPQYHVPDRLKPVYLRPPGRSITESGG